VEDLTKHKVDSERIRITEEAAEIVNKARTTSIGFVLLVQQLSGPLKAPFPQAVT